MPIHSSAVGTRLDSCDAQIDVRRILAYAAGIGDVCEPCFDDDRRGGVVAPPSLCVSLEWQVVIAGRAGSVFGAAPEELRRGVHAAQDTVFHRPIRPGDELRTEGRVIAVRPSRAGAVTVTKLETLDAASGEPVATSWSTSIHRSVAVQGEAAALEDLPSIPHETEEVESEEVEIPIPREMPHVYTECADIWNPIHTERTVALAAGLPDIILHGTATWALAGREVVRRFCGGDPTKLRRLHGRFRAMVIPGTSIRVRLGREELGTIRFVVLNQEGEEAISSGYAEIR